MFNASRFYQSKGYFRFAKDFDHDYTVQLVAKDWFSEWTCKRIV